jgi:quercetin dioxygenase-like cupin family protein
MTAHIRRAAEIPIEPVSAGTRTTRQVLTEPSPGSAFHMRKFSMAPGGGMPPHTNRIEHQQLVLRGEAIVGLGDEEVRVRAGDVLQIPAGLPHWYRAEGSEPFEFLCAVPNTEDEINVLPGAIPPGAE